MPRFLHSNQVPLGQICREEGGHLEPIRNTVPEHCATASLPLINTVYVSTNEAAADQVANKAAVRAREADTGFAATAETIAQPSFGQN
jgi:hypothetical protein